MTLSVEPLSLRLPRDLLVLQPMQGHLDLEPVLLSPGMRCVIGSAEGCAVRLTSSDFVQPEHCVVEVIGRQTLLTKWLPESTWLNDRLVDDQRELVPGDRISLGPFDFQVRTSSPDELLYAKLVDRDSSDTNKVEDVLRLKRAIDSSTRDKNSGLSKISGEPALDLFGDLLRETTDSSDSDTHERLTQHISKLLGDLQSQVFALQEKEAELNDQLRSQREVTDQRRPETEPQAGFADSNRKSVVVVTSDSIPASVRPDYEQVLQLLKTERDQLDGERAQLADEQARWQEQQQDWTQRLQSLELQLAELETQRHSVIEERDICRTLAAELMRDQVQIAKREERLGSEERELASLRDELSRREQAISAKREVAISPESTRRGPAVHSFADPELVIPTNWRAQLDLTSDSERPASTVRTFQTLLTLVTFTLAAIFLSGSLGNHAAYTTLGWGIAIVGALSTADLLLRRCFSTSR